VETVIEVNSAQKARMVQKIREALGGSEASKKIAVLGLTFKPETDDMREAPSLTILPALAEKGAKIRAHDPQGMEAAKKLMPEVSYAKDPYEACRRADCVVLMTEWNEYRSLDFDKIKKLVKDNVFVDLRNVYEPEILKEKGFEYFGVGRG
jgi:UDPglucose 6-dehydrogenase